MTIQQALFAGGAAAVTYATLNPADKDAGITLSGGDLTAAGATSVRATISKSSGKWYWEVTQNAITTFGGLFGIAKSTESLASYVGNGPNGYGYYANTGAKYNSSSPVAYGSGFTTGDVIGIAWDADAGTIEFYKNNVSQGVAYTGLSGAFFPAVSGAAAGSSTCTVNFGATAFVYTPPSGFNSGVYT